MAQSPNADVQAALDLFNKSQGLPTTKKPLLTLGTLTAADLAMIEQTMLTTTGTFQVSGTTLVTGTSPALPGGTTVVYPAPTNSPADTTNILQVLNTFTKPTVATTAAGPDLVADVYSGFGTLGTAIVSSTSTLWSTVAEAAATDSLYSGLGETKADAAELAVLEAAVAHAATYAQTVADVLLASDPSAAAEATLVTKTDAKVPAPSIMAIGSAIIATDSNVNGGLFIQNFYLDDKVQADQEGLVEGYTAGDTASVLETTASNVVANAPSALSATSRTNLALGLITSGTLAGDGTNATIIAVTTGVVSGYINGAPGVTSNAVGDTDRAKLASSIVTSYGLPYAAIIAGAGAVNLNDPQDDVASYAATVAKNSIIKADATGVAESGVAGGVGNDFALVTSTDSADISLKVAVTQGVINAYKAYAGEIVTAVVGQILAESYNTTQFTAALGAYIQDLCTPSAALAPNDALDGTMLEALSQACLTSGSAIGSIPQLAVKAIAGAVDNTVPKDVNLVVQPTLDQFYGSGSASEVEAIASAVAQSGTAGALAPDVLTAALITGAKTTGTLVEQIAIGATLNTGVTADPTYGNADTFVKDLAADLIGSSFDIQYVALGLAGSGGLNNPVEVAGDLGNGAGAKQYATIGDTLAGQYPTQSAAIAGAVAGSAGVTTDAIRGKLAIDVLATAGVGSTYAAAVSGSVGAFISTDADKTSFAESIAKTYNADATPIAVAVGDTINAGTDSSFIASLDAIAAGVAKTVTSATVTTATAVEEVALSDSGDPVATATAFGTSFTGTPAAVVGIAYTAAKGQSVGESGTVGLTIATLAKVVTSPSLTGSVAQQAAAAAAQYTIPGDPYNVTNDKNNYSYYTVAGIIGSQTSNAKLALDFGVIGGDLAAGLLQSGSSGETGGAANQAAAAIVYNLIAQGLNSSTYSKTNAAEILAIAEAVATAQPSAAADIFGYAAEAVELAAEGQTTWAAKNGTGTNLSVLIAGLQSGIESAASADSSQSAAIDAAVSSVYTSSSNNILSDFDLTTQSVMTTTQADETPIVNF
jgi:hypothetical protein